MPPKAKTADVRSGRVQRHGHYGAQPFDHRDAAAAPGFGTCCLNIDGVKYTFSGAPSHQMTPWAGRNALEAVIHLFNQYRRGALQAFVRKRAFRA